MQEGRGSAGSTERLPAQQRRAAAASAATAEGDAASHAALSQRAACSAAMERGAQPGAHRTAPPGQRSRSGRTAVRDGRRGSFARPNPALGSRTARPPRRSRPHSGDAGRGSGSRPVPSAASPEGRAPPEAGPRSAAGSDAARKRRRGVRSVRPDPAPVPRIPAPHSPAPAERAAPASAPRRPRRHPGHRPAHARHCRGGERLRVRVRAVRGGRRAERSAGPALAARWHRGRPHSAAGPGLSPFPA